MKTRRTGVIIGRFNPPHNGHRYLIDFARTFVDELYIFVCTLSKDLIPGELRYEWVQEMYPTCRTVHITEENPDANRNQPDAHKIWSRAIVEKLENNRADYLFASEDYGWKLAGELGAEFIPVDPNRDQLPISGTDIRNNPLKFWQYLPQNVRPYFVKRIGIIAGSDSSAITSQLASRFQTLYAPHYEDFYREIKSQHQQHTTIHETRDETIQHAQHAMEQALSRQSNRLLFLSIDRVSGSIEDIIAHHRLDLCIVVESLLNDDERQAISHAVSLQSNESSLNFAVFHWSAQLLDSIHTHIEDFFHLDGID